MVRGLIISLFLSLLSLPVQAQILQGIAMTQPGSAGVTPGIVNLHAGSSTGTQSAGLGARVTGSSTCVVNAYCTSLPKASVSGNTIVVPYVYTSTSTTAHAPTVTDDKSGGSSTYTCVTEGNDGSGTTRTFAGWCYSFNVASGIRAITITYPVATNTHGQAVAMQLYNVVTGDTLSATNGTQTPNTTFTSGAITTTANGDFVCSMTVGTTTRRNLSTKFTAGSGFSMYTNDTFDGMGIQCGIQSSAGSITTTMTGLSNTYVALTISFKAGTSGTAPSGMYIISELHQTTDSGATGPFTVQMPSAGANLLVAANQCGGTTPMTVSSISDGTNTWKATGSTVTTDANGNGSGRTFYAENATGSATLALTITTAGTGDCSFWLYAIAGAANSVLTAHREQCHASRAAATFYPCNDNSAATIIGATFSPFAANNPAGLFPGSSAGISIGTMGVSFNTIIGATSPSAENFDSDTTGGENLDGPWPVDQNNAVSNAVHTDNSAQTITYSNTDASEDIQFYWAIRDSFAAATATKYPSYMQGVACKATASGTSLTCAITPHNTGNTIVVMTSDGTTSAHTITLTDSASNTITQVSGNTSATIITSTGGMKAWYVLSANGTSADTFTFTWSTANTYRTAWIVELANVSALDKSSITTAVTAGGAGAFSSASSGTLTSAHEIVLGWNVCTASCELPASGVNLVQWDDTTALTSYNGQYAEWFAVNATTAVTTNFVDPGSTNGTNEGAGMVTFQ